MAEPLYNQVMRQLEQAAGFYYRLTLVVAPRGAGKTVALQEVATRTGALRGRRRGRPTSTGYQPRRLRE